MLRELNSNIEKIDRIEEQNIDNKIKIDKFEENIEEELNICKQNLELYLNQLELCQNEAELIQEVDLKIQNWKFLLELQDESF